MNSPKPGDSYLDNFDKRTRTAVKVDDDEGTVTYVSIGDGQSWVFTVSEKSWYREIVDEGILLTPE